MFPEILSTVETIILQLVGGDWNHGMDYDFPETVGNVMSSQLTKSRSPSLFRGVG
jgi:hypothetical protein